MPTPHTERYFEAAIERHLLDHGWHPGNPATYDRHHALDTSETFAFIGATQQPAWDQLVQRHGGADQAQAKFRQRLVDELDRRGTIDVLRRGVTDLGVRIDLAYFRPAHGLTPELQHRYAANRCTVVRQLRYAARHDAELDLALFVNGLPVATAELKNPLTGQGVEQAVAQYRRDRDPKDAMLSGRRAFAHFAVDPDLAHLTTRLEGGRTRFLPFNQGSGGPGRAGGQGNPPNADGYRTAYLWEEVWERDAWLELLARFVHVEPGGGKRAAVIFPRYHQWDAVRRMVAHAREHGAGQSYLIQHSAGSGKSNTIAWTAHQLSSLHDASDHKVFSKVIVITDRVVLDRQLQDTVFQFDHKPGVVRKIDRDSTQLGEALAGGEAQVIITTLQKFPFVLGHASSGRYAIIVDEAHSSQTGETAKALKTVLGAGSSANGSSGEENAALTSAEVEETAQEAAGDPDEALALMLETRGRQPNLSFFAFTATPKPKTGELFGTRDADGRRQPFHLYSMRQAIEEGFILDVLANYTTYGSYWKVAAHAAEDPDVDKAKAAAAIARFVSLHPTNIAQKVEVIVEHFRGVTAKKIGGRAKAMIVTRSRLHAVRYKQAFDRYVKEKDYADLRALVAFSGTVLDEEGAEYTEPRMNEGLPESQLPERFASDDYQVLIVAEKYQTGFDQPLLHTIYVDKKLEGVRAVQTLSRLNRIHPGKSDTFVLDFANDAAEIRESFAPFFEATIVEPTDPNVLYNAADHLRGFGVVEEGEVDAFVAAFLAGGGGSERGAHAKLYGYLDPALRRFEALPDDDDSPEEFRAALTAFVRMYAFLAQIVPWADVALEKLYTFARFLELRLPRAREGKLDLSDEVELTHLRTQLTGEHDLSLTEGGEVVSVYFGEGSGREAERPTAALSEIVAALNERFGTQFTEADQVFFDQLAATAVEDSTLAAQAQANTLENFRFGFDRVFEGLVIDRQDANGEIVSRILDNREFGEFVRRELGRNVYEKLRATA